MRLHPLELPSPPRGGGGGLRPNGRDMLRKGKKKRNHRNYSKKTQNKTFPPFQALHDSSRLPSASRSRLCPYLEPCLPDCEHLELTSYEYVIPTDAERLCMDRESPFRFRSQNFFLSV